MSHENQTVIRVTQPAPIVIRPLPPGTKLLSGELVLTEVQGDIEVLTARADQGDARDDALQDAIDSVNNSLLTHIQSTDPHPNITSTTDHAGLAAAGLA